jgi:hypothetical protein
MSDLQWGGDLPHGGAWLRGYFCSPWRFTETVARLIAASGQPAKSMDEYKTSVNFRGAFKGSYFSLYDYKEDREIHIGGDNTLDVEGLQAALIEALAAVAPVTYEAQEYYDRKRSHSFSGK